MYKNKTKSVQRVNKYKKKTKLSLCSKNRLGKNGSLFKVNGGRGPYEQMWKNEKKCENYSGRFPEGVPKKEIQQWRQARSRPGEKETHNTKLREKGKTGKKKKNAKCKKQKM